MFIEAFYPWTLIVMLLAVVWWFYRDSISASRLMPALAFWASSILYAMIVFITAFSNYYKLILMIPRDLTAFVIVGFLANNLKSTRSFFMLAMGVGFGSYLLYSNFVPDTYQKYFSPKNTTVAPRSEKTNNLAPNGELLVDLKNVDNIGGLKVLLKAFDVELTPAFPDVASKDITELDDYFLVNIPDAQLGNIKAIEKLLRESGLIDWVERNEAMSLSPIETTPSKNETTSGDYGVNDPSLDKVWSFDKLGIADYFKYIKDQKVAPKKRAKIAILDTGVDSAHEDLKANYTSTKKEYDRDKQSHGTHCAGIAASVTNNGLGIASLALNGEFVQVTSVKVLSDQGWGTQDGIIKGIILAADKGADVISMSLGGPSSDASQRAYNEAIRYANSKGAIVVVAAGNESQNATKSVPASCEGVITVSAINSRLEKASFSNYVQDLKMGIAAPGEDILSTIPKNQYASYSGTSMATPFVAGLLGVMKAIDPQLSTKGAYKILTETGKETKNPIETGKLVNPLGVLQKMKGNK
jgi:thermitase